MQKLKNARITILVVTGALVSIGVIMIYSSSAVYAYERFGDNLFFLKHHFASLGIGLVLALICMRIDVDILRKHSKKFIIASILLLVLVLVPGLGSSIGGARRWLKISGMQFQPIEIIKPFFQIGRASCRERV